MSTLDEFDVIRRYFSDIGATSIGAGIGVGDDAAVLPSLPSGVVVATDTLIEGVHFPVSCAGGYVASRALRTNLSDFAAMGAKPQWLTLALTLPAIDEAWLQDFSRQLREESERFGLRLIGGDTCRGPLSLNMTVIGGAEDGLLYRHNACVGDSLWISGSLGDAAAGLNILQDSALELDSVVPNEDRAIASDRQYLLRRYYMPEPRLSLGEALRGYAHAAIDVSDGLLADALHLAERSKVAVVINCDVLPLSTALTHVFSQWQSYEWALTGGDDYELLFTSPAGNDSSIARISEQLGLLCTRIGYIEKGAGVRTITESSCTEDIVTRLNLDPGYRHFR